MFFFFKQKTAYEMRISDWSSDVCSSDLHGVAPVVEQWQRAGVLHQRPQPVEPVSGIPGQKRQRAGVGLVWLHAATIEQPHVRQRTEQRSPVGAGDALFQVLDVADEDRDGCALLGDDRSEEHTSELQSLMRISYAVFCLKKKQSTAYNKKT